MGIISLVIKISFLLKLQNVNGNVIIALEGTGDMGKTKNTHKYCCTWNWLAQKTTTNHIISSKGLIIIRYYMAVSHKDWELPNSRI